MVLMGMGMGVVMGVGVGCRRVSEYCGEHMKVRDGSVVDVDKHIVHTKQYMVTWIQSHLLLT